MSHDHDHCSWVERCNICCTTLWRMTSPWDWKWMMQCVLSKRCPFWLYCQSSGIILIWSTMWAVSATAVRNTQAPHKRWMSSLDDDNDFKCVLHCFVLGNRDSHGVLSWANQGARTHDWESPTCLLALSFLTLPGLGWPDRWPSS